MDFYLLEGESMIPTFQPFGEIVIINKLSPRFYGYKKNDVISLSNPTNPDAKICKRIIYDEGDNFSNSHGIRTTVPQNHVWVEGDNKSNSLDSRKLGPISKHLIAGKVTFRVWPLRYFGWYKNKYKLNHQTRIDDLKKSNL